MLFVRNLPYFCEARDLVNAFWHRMRISIVKAKVFLGLYNQPLHYGIVYLHNPEDRKRVCETMSGYCFQGRNIM